jgi:hypothetical protein
MGFESISATNLVLLINDDTVIMVNVCFIVAILVGHNSDGWSMGTKWFSWPY